MIPFAKHGSLNLTFARMYTLATLPPEIINQIVDTNHVLHLYASGDQLLCLRLKQTQNLYIHDTWVDKKRRPKWPTTFLRIKPNLVSFTFETRHCIPIDLKLLPPTLCNLKLVMPSLHDCRGTDWQKYFPNLQAIHLEEVGVTEYASVFLESSIGLGLHKLPPFITSAVILSKMPYCASAYWSKFEHLRHLTLQDPERLDFPSNLKSLEIRLTHNNETVAMFVNILKAVNLQCLLLSSFIVRIKNAEGWFYTSSECQMQIANLLPRMLEDIKIPVFWSNGVILHLPPRLSRLRIERPNTESLSILAAHSLTTLNIHSPNSPLGESWFWASLPPTLRTLKDYQMFGMVYSMPANVTLPPSLTRLIAHRFRVYTRVKWPNSLVELELNDMGVSYPPNLQSLTLQEFAAAKYLPDSITDLCLSSYLHLPDFIYPKSLTRLSLSGDVFGHHLVRQDNPLPNKLQTLNINDCGEIDYVRLFDNLPAALKCLRCSLNDSFLTNIGNLPQICALSLFVRSDSTSLQPIGDVLPESLEELEITWEGYFDVPFSKLPKHLRIFQLTGEVVMSDECFDVTMPELEVLKAGIAYKNPATTFPYSKFPRLKTLSNS